MPEWIYGLMIERRVSLKIAAAGVEVVILKHIFM